MQTIIKECYEKKYGTQKYENSILFSTFEDVVTASMIKCREILSKDIDNCRNYLMGVEPEDFTVEDALEKLGFNRNGFHPTPSQ